MKEKTNHNTMKKTGYLDGTFHEYTCWLKEKTEFKGDNKETTREIDTLVIDQDFKETLLNFLKFQANLVNLSNIVGEDKATKNFLENEKNQKLMHCKSSAELARFVLKNIENWDIFKIKNDEQNPENTVIEVKSLFELKNNETEQKQVVPIYYKILIQPNANPKLLSMHCDSRTLKEKGEIKHGLEFNKMEEKKELKDCPIMEESTSVKKAGYYWKRLFERYSIKVNYETKESIFDYVKARYHAKSNVCWIFYRDVKLKISKEKGSSIIVKDGLKDDVFYGKKSLDDEIKSFEESYKILSPEEKEKFFKGEEVSVKIPCFAIRTGKDLFTGNFKYTLIQVCTNGKRSFAVRKGIEEFLGKKINKIGTAVKGNELDKWYREYFDKEITKITNHETNVKAQTTITRP